jgi:hypothetical protein
MKDLAKAKALFRKAGLPFPYLPKKLASSLQEQGNWLYSTRPINEDPYFLGHYIEEIGKSELGDYALLAHSGYGANSYAIQYYLTSGPLRLFLFLGWGGVYMDNEETITNITICFNLAEEIIKAAQEKLRLEFPLTIIVSDFYGTYWSHDENDGKITLSHSKAPQEILGEALAWLKT